MRTFRERLAWHRWLPAGIAAVAAACAQTSAPTGFETTVGSGSGGGNGSGGSGGSFGGNGGFGSGVGLGGTSGSPGTCVTDRSCSSQCGDFDSAPVLDGNAQAFMPSSSTSGGPCILEPGDGSLLPNNWVRPRIRWTGGSPPFQITIHSAREANDLVVYTSSSQWTMPADTWKALAGNAWDDGSGSDAIRVNVADKTGASFIKFSIAPAAANGSMVYWTAAGDTNGWSWLEGFGVGDETVATVLTAPTGPYANSATQVQWSLSRDVGGNLTTQNRDTYMTEPTGGVECIGCHVAVPDTNTVAFVDFYPWDGVASRVDMGNAGQTPTWLTPGGAELLSQGWLGMMSFSPAVWGAGNYRAVAGTQVPSNATNPPWSAGNSQSPSNLIWMDLGTSATPSFVQNGMTSSYANQNQAMTYYANKGTAFGYIARNGDPNPSASCPTWSHDGKNIVYVSNNAAQDGRLATGNADLYVVPYADGQGGDAKPLSGAATSLLNEYYPAYSPDDAYVAYTAVPAGKSMYYNADAEIYVIPAGGGTATRLVANDPPMCLGAPSPGVTNSWPRWSPEHPSCNGKTYYWLIFSSSRLNIPFTVDMTKQNFKTSNGAAGMPDGPTSQLYLTAIVDTNGEPVTYKATYIWNQSTQTSDGFAQSNHTPAWETVNIPAPPPPK